MHFDTPNIFQIINFIRRLRPLAFQCSVMRAQKLNMVRSGGDCPPCPLTIVEPRFTDPNSAFPPNLYIYTIYTKSKPRFTDYLDLLILIFPSPARSVNRNITVYQNAKEGVCASFHTLRNLYCLWSWFMQNGLLIPILQ